MRFIYTKKNITMNLPNNIITTIKDINLNISPYDNLRLGVFF